jgi:hypothetical protein
MALYAGTSTVKTVVLGSYTTTQRDALTGLSTGTLLYNSTTNKHQYYNGSSWSDINVPVVTINTGNITFMQCMDHYSTFYYDGNGNFYVESREPSGNIHTGRGDCSDAQGQILRYTFNKAGYSSITGSISMSGRDGSATLNFSNINPNSTYGPTNIGITDNSSGASGYSYTLNMTIT